MLVDNCKHIWNGETVAFNNGNSASITCSLCKLPYLFSEEAKRFNINTEIPPFQRQTLLKRRPDISQTKRQFVFARDGHKCLRCGNIKLLTIDHVVPFAMGGDSGVDNLQTLCFPCNNWKGTDSTDYRDTSTDLTEEEALAYFQECLNELKLSTNKNLFVE